VTLTGPPRAGPPRAGPPRAGPPRAGPPRRVGLLRPPHLPPGARSVPTGERTPLRRPFRRHPGTHCVPDAAARLKDGSRKIVNITEIYGIDDDEILTQDIFEFEQTGIRDGKVEGLLKPTGMRPTFMGKFKANGIQLPPGEFGIPPEDLTRDATRRGKGRSIAGESLEQPDVSRPPIGLGRAVKAGGMVYISSMGPVDPEGGRVVSGAIGEQARQCLTNLKAKLEAEGSSLEKIVWATGRCAIRPSSTPSTRNGSAGSRATHRSVRGR